MNRKAESLIAAAQAAGWGVKPSTEGDREVLHVRRGVEQFSFAWTAGRFEKGRYRHGQHAQEWANVAAAIRHMQLPPGATRVVDGTLVILPFDIEEADDAAVLDALAGKRLTWANSLSPEIESGDVPRAGKQTKIEPSKRFANNGERILTFADAEGGFRSVALSALRSAA